jgi:RNA polymerase sigma-70 factor, ECF subfamily
MSKIDLKTQEIDESNSDLDALIQTAQKDPQQFAALYDRFLNPLYRYLYQRLGNRQDAEEVTSQTFMAAFEAFSHYSHRGYFAAWLFSIARKKLADHYRKNRSLQPLDETSVLADDPHYMRQAIHSESLGTLNEAIRSLKEEERELLRLRFTAELNYRQIAVLLNKNEAAVKKSVYRLLARLQSQLEEENV